MKPPSPRILLIAAVTSSALASPVWATDYRMVQTNKTFVGDVSDEEAAKMSENLALAKAKKVEVLKLKVGDTVSFA
jgi:hypothetical protein